MHIDVSELNQLAVDLGKASGQVIAATSVVIRKTAFDIERDAKLLVPVDTGNLRNSITTSARALEAEIGPTAEYAAFVEYGTSVHAPQPYMGPAADRNVGLLEKAVDQILGGIL